MVKFSQESLILLMVSLNHQKDINSLHDENKLPLTDEKGQVFCAYSLDEKMPPCPTNHRGPGVEIVIDGVKKEVYLCWDGRMRDNLKPIKQLK